MDQITQLLIDCYKFDVAVFSQPWIYYTVFPAIFYFAFFMLKWTVLTAPIWLPLKIVVTAFKVKV